MGAPEGSLAPRRTGSNVSPTYRDPWYRAEEHRVHARVLDYVSTVEQAQCDIFDRFVKLECLYDPNGPVASANLPVGAKLGGVTENVIASNVDTVSAAISTVDVRSRFMTDGGDWGDQRTARHLEWYVEGVAKQLGRVEVCQLAFKAAAKKGTGVVKVYADPFDDIRVEHVLVDDIIVDEKQCRNGGRPRELHQRRFVDRHDLAAMFPDHEERILVMQSGSGGRVWAGYRPIEDNEIVVVESWRLPIGKPGKPGYRVGRHTWCADGIDLLDEEWSKPFFPFARIVWTERDAGWYGISLAERIAGHQRALNRRNQQIERALDLGAYPTTYVRRADANLAVKTQNQIGQVVVYNSDVPQTVTAPVVSGETYKSRDDIKISAGEESGVNRMLAHGTKPAGIDSGVAMREYRDQTTQRFALQERAFEKLNLDVDWLILDACKDLGKDAPVIMRRTKFGARKVKWSDVDMGDVRVQIVAASTLPRTPSGRSQLVLEWAQAGVISLDVARRLMGHPDLEKELSLYTAALEGVEHAIEEIEDGRVAVPEPFDNLEMIVWRGQQRYLEIRDMGAPESILEALRQYVVTAAWMIDQKQAANTNANAEPAPAGAVSGAPAAPPMAPPDPTGGVPMMGENALDPAMMSAPVAA
jgi:hypothetical protein